MTTEASIKALLDPINAKTRWVHRKIIHNALKGCELTYLEIAAKVVLKPEQVWKRCSDMYKEDIFIIVGKKEENGRPHSIYAHNPEPPNPNGKKPTFAEYAKTRKDWKHQYRVLIHHEI
jgi:hypothetical protein